MRTVILILSFLLTDNNNLSAQTSNDIVPVEVIPLQSQLTARFNFIGLLDVLDENVSFGGEYRFAANWSAGSDLAYIFYSEYLSESKTSRGFILRPFVRYYPKTNRNTFFEAGLHYKHVSYEIEDWVGRDVVNGQPAYEEYATFHFIKHAYEANLKAGTATNLSRNEKLRIEFYGGLGIRFKEQGSNKMSYMRNRGIFSDIYNPRYSTVVIPMGMRLVYGLK